MIRVFPDEIPETDEQLLVTLDGVAPPRTQRLRPEASRVLVTVQENDNPGGIFQFSSAAEDSYTVQVRGPFVCFDTWFLSERTSPRQTHAVGS